MSCSELMFFLQMMLLATWIGVAVYAVWAIGEYVRQARERGRW